jgi:mRNA interferase YafQ
VAIVWSEYFRRAFKRLVRKNPGMQEVILNTLDDLAQDPFTPTLKTHKLKGNLQGLWACSVEYDCRITFEFQSDKDSNESFILLVDIGSHDDVY